MDTYLQKIVHLTPSGPDMGPDTKGAKMPYCEPPYTEHEYEPVYRCVSCDGDFPPEETFLLREKLYCTECVPQEHCKGCDRLTNITELDVTPKGYCPECSDQLTEVCCRCQATHPVYDMDRVEGYYFCSECTPYE